MKVPRDGSDTGKGNPRTNCCGDGKTREECKAEEGDVSGIEPSTTALIPPWLRNTLGLAEKGDKKPNQKCLKVYCANDDAPCVETGEMRADADGDCLKCHFYIQDTPSANPILEVNIGSEADFLQDAGTAEKLSSPWRSKPSRHDAGIFGTVKDREMSRSEVTSIDVVVPTEDQDEEKRKFRPHKTKTRRRTSNSCEDNPTGDTHDDFAVDEPFANGKYLDARLLLLCGKKTIDNLTQEDVALLQEMKNQIGHKEGFEKLFNEIRESAFTERVGRKSDKINPDFLCKSEENKTKNRAVDEERKLSDDGRKHHEKKTRNQQRQKCIDEPEVEKDKKGDKWRCPWQKRDAHTEKKSKLRHGDYTVIEKVVTDTLQKFIDLYRVQVPQDVINSMKKNIIQTLQSEYQETNGSRRGLEAVLAVQDQLKNAGIIKCSMHHLLIEERDEKPKMGDPILKRIEPPTNFTSEENVVSRDVPTDETKDSGRTETLNTLRKDFERCLELIQNQLDVTGTRLCSVVLEKIGTEDKNLRIVHNFSNGVTESVNVYDRPNKGSPEGDNLNTAACECQRNYDKVKRSQWCQTGGKTYGKVSTQTDWVDVSVKHLKNADLTPGLYRITKATESGRFYLTPESLDEEDSKVKRVSSELCVRQDAEKVMKYASRETFISERGNIVASARAVWRAFRSDCAGLNNQNEENTTETPVKEQQEDADDVVEIDVEEELEKVSKDDGYHRECVWLWNGKKMSPGIDLKVHVEDLLREKLNEMLSEGRVAEGKTPPESALLSNPNMTAEKEMSAKNLEIRKTRAKFCMANEEGSTVTSPFIFRGSGPPMTKPADPKTFGKSVREVGTQNSHHTVVSLNMKQRSKLCTVAKFSKRKQANKPQQTKTVHPFGESVGEAKKVKLEFWEGNELPANREVGSNTDSVRECFSIISNASSSSNDGPVRVKLIGIEVSKEKTPGEGDCSSGKSSDTKGVEESPTKDEQRKYKHWEIIENVLNRVSQKEKDILWNDIRYFVKKKIGRDINDEGAREVCIEIEQDVPKFAKGKPSHMVVARGNYTRNEGDVEVEVDLTLDDLERILRHRQKKMRRRKHSQKTDSKESSTSSDTITDCHTFKCRSFIGEDYITSSEVKRLKEHNS